MPDVYIVGTSMTRFSKNLGATVKGLAAEAVAECLKDAGIDRNKIEACYVSNSFWGFFSKQQSIRGQVMLRPSGIEGIPVVNTENACAGGGTALHLAYAALKAGIHDLVMVVGTEKASHENKALSMEAYTYGIDVEDMENHIKRLLSLNGNVRLDEQSASVGNKRTLFMDIYASICRWHMRKYGTTRRQLAVISAKNHYHGSLNDLAQIRKPMTIEEVLADVPVSFPLTRAMCSPVSDGSAALILCSENYLKRLTGAKPVKIRASVLGSGTGRPIDGEDIGVRVSGKAYEHAGMGPEDINVVECHDATAFGELHQYETLGFCPEGEGGHFAETGETALGGKTPFNTSGGLESRGHPVGATGLAQIYELVAQLRGEAGPRQVNGARTGMACNSGGNLDYEEAAMAVHILEKV